MSNPKNSGQSGDSGRKPFDKAGLPRQGNQSRGTQSPGAKNPRDALPQGPRREESRKPVASKLCVACGKPIFDLAGAIADKDSGEPIHFDCALERVVAAESLAENEKIAYLGAGCFGVVTYKNGIDGAFTIKRRIRWEKEGEKQPWRKEISSYITKI